jgi:DNA-directed RNA polymerase subunit beta
MYNLRAIYRLLKFFLMDKDGTLKNDQQNDLGNLRVRLIGDFLDDARDEWLSALYRRILKQSSNEPLVLTDALREANGLASGRSLFADFFRQWSVDLPICQRIPPDKSNYVAAAALSRRLTFNGRGGIKIGHDRPMRDFNWSHYGRLCPFDTPLSVDVGVTLSLARGARVSELGLIETPCARVESGKISEDIVWLSPWDEADGRCGWIAFPDERELLVAGDLVYVHRGDRTLNRVPAAEATHIHVSEEAMISIAACLIPYRAHNDAVRMNMACNFLRQALPLSNMMPPAVKTDAEYLLPRALPFRVGLHDQDTLAFGTDIFVGYLPWKGWNFEDAIVISESAAEALTSLHFERLRPVRLGRSIAMQEMAYLIA